MSIPGMRKLCIGSLADFVIVLGNVRFSEEPNANFILTLLFLFLFGVMAFIGGIQVISYLVSKGVTSAATALGASDETAREIGSFAGRATARMVGAVVVADVLKNVSINNTDVSSVTTPSTIDTDSVVNIAASTSDISDTFDTSSSFSGVGDSHNNIAADNGVMGTSIDNSKTTSSMNAALDTSIVSAMSSSNSFDMPVDSAAKFDFDLSRSDDVDSSSFIDTTSVNRNVNITDESGFNEATITRISDHSSIIKDNTGITIGDIKTDFNGNTAVSMNNQEIIRITDDGTILNSLGLSDGYIVDGINGEKIIQDNLGKTLRIIKPDGTILDALHHTIGHING